MQFQPWLFTLGIVVIIASSWSIDENNKAGKTSWRQDSENGSTRERKREEKCGKGGSQYLHVAKRPEVHSSDEETRSSSAWPTALFTSDDLDNSPSLRESRESRETSLWGLFSRRSRRVASREIPREPPRSFSLRVFPSVRRETAVFRGWLSNDDETISLTAKGSKGQSQLIIHNHFLPRFSERISLFKNWRGYSFKNRNISYNYLLQSEQRVF